MRTRLAGLIVCMTLGLAGVDARQNQVGVVTFSPFESYIESLRLQAGIPGISAVLIQDGEIAWERGLGFQNQESRLRATPDTPYPIADLSETIASVLVLQCAEQRRFQIDDAAQRYGAAIPEPSATLRHLLSHTSAGSPGDTFHFDPDRYSQLTQVVESCVTQPYRKTVAVNVLERLAMKDSVPGRDLVDPSALTERLFADEIVDRYRRVIERMAVPYRVDKRGRATRNELSPEGITAATGLISTVRDLARFDQALDSFLLLKEETLAAAFTNQQSGSTIGQRSVFPTGLGWFVQTYRGEPVIWHFGLIPNAYSSLIVKLPSKHLTLILLANSDGLSSPYQLDLGDVTRSVFATLFLRLYA